MFLDRFRIGARLGAGFFAVLAVSAAITFVGASRLAAISELSRQMMAVPMAKSDLAEEWFTIMSVGIKRTAATAKSSDPSLVPYFAKEAKAGSERVNEIWKAVSEMPATDDEKKLLNAIQEMRKPYIEARDAVSAAKVAGQAAEVERAFEQA